MKVYLVGGAVRDQLLGLPVKERDWVVVGATPHEMLKRGFKQVGKDFPVFLHPKTHEEYALARTEKKIGKGYRGFSCYASPNVTLAEDLKRRDLTINAIAQDSYGKIIDPYHGREDLKKRILRHISPSFAEDPVRILRVARFASRFGDFKIHPTTNKLMKKMVSDGEVDALVPERVWQELIRAVQEPYPERFFMVLKNCGALLKLFPEISSHLSQVKKSLKSVVKLSRDSKVRIAAMTFDLNREEIVKLCKNYKTPNIYRELSLLTIRLKQDLLTLSRDAENIIILLEQSDAYRKPERLKQALIICWACDKKYSKAYRLVLRAYAITKDVRLTPKIIAGEDKNNLRQIIHDLRSTKLKTVLSRRF